MALSPKLLSTATEYLKNLKTGIFPENLSTFKATRSYSLVSLGGTCGAALRLGFLKVVFFHPREKQDGRGRILMDFSPQRRALFRSF